MIKGLSHITLIVSDLEKSSSLFQDMLQANEVYSSENNTYISPTKFLTIGEIWITLIKGETKNTSYEHIAFLVSSDELKIGEEKAAKLNLKIHPLRREQKGKSFYFYDYDNHLFELYTETLKERLDFYK